MSNLHRGCLPDSRHDAERSGIVYCQGRCKARQDSRHNEPVHCHQIINIMVAPDCRRPFIRKKCYKLARFVEFSNGLLFISHPTDESRPVEKFPALRKAVWRYPAAALSSSPGNPAPHPGYDRLRPQNQDGCVGLRQSIARPFFGLLRTGASILRFVCVCRISKKDLGIRIIIESVLTPIPVFDS